MIIIINKQISAGGLTSPDIPALLLVVTSSSLSISRMARLCSADPELFLPDKDFVCQRDSSQAGFGGHNYSGWKVVEYA
jgi:hypothetical protein